MYRSLSREAFVKALQAYTRAAHADVRPAGSGFAPGGAPDGALVDDFRIVETERMVHMLGSIARSHGLDQHRQEHR
jgi:L-2-hydroxyglutarate oxidase